MRLVDPDTARDLEVHQRRQIEALEALGVVRGVEELSLERAASRGDPLGVFARALEGRAREHVPVVEVILDRTWHREMTLNAYLDGSPSTRAFHAAYVHAEGSNVFRYLPLDVLLAGVAVCSPTPLPRLVRTTAPSTLEELRDLALQDARPLCVPDATSSASFRVHGAELDGYRMALHDVSHVAVLGDRPVGRSRDAARVFDALEQEIAAMERASGELAHDARPRLHELLDHVISGYHGVAATIWHLDVRGVEMAADHGERFIGLGARTAARLAQVTA